ncbi:MAG TPA: alginate lyase family protein [Candidatus Aquilonibacter sp.]|nr:alginate lyase family protein [Candidatus Aquilonibacter sp.]
MKTTLSLTLIALVFGGVSLHAQKIADPSASVLDVQARRAFLKSTTDPRIRSAMKQLGSCVASPMVAAPVGEMQIPHHYMHGSNGPTNPAEAEATRTYGAFEKRITAGMNQWVATGNEAEARCALDQLDAWAKAKALTNYDPKAYSQSWYQAEWTLSSAGVTDSVLKQDGALDSVEQERVTDWLRKAAHQLISYEKPGLGNNHHYWRALAATSIGVLSNDDKLFRDGVEVFKQAVSQEDDSGAFPLEMARHENAIHYQAFALQPLIMIAEFGERQHVDLYGVTAHGRTIRNAVLFLGEAIGDPGLVKKYTDDVQKTNFSPDGIAELEFYLARFGAAGISSSITNLLQRPVSATRIGGSTTVLAGK